MAINHKVSFSASSDRVYELLTDGAKFAAATGKPARIEPGEGAPFSVFGDFIQGRQIELIPGKRIVQAWRFSVWEPGVYSLVRLTLTPHDTGTDLVLDQEAIPAGASPMYSSWKEHIAANWPTFYFEPFKRYLAGEPEFAS